MATSKRPSLQAQSRRRWFKRLNGLVPRLALTAAVVVAANGAGIPSSVGGQGDAALGVEAGATLDGNVAGSDEEDDPNHFELLLRECDTNKDGALSLEETLRATNHDGGMREVELALLEAGFRAGDADGDRKLVLDEIPGMFAYIEGKNQDEEEQEAEEGAQESDDASEAQSVLDALDSDADGFLSLPELLAVASEDEANVADEKLAREAFEIADLDNDMKLTTSEIPTMLRYMEDSETGGGDEL